MVASVVGVVALAFVLAMVSDSVAQHVLVLRFDFVFSKPGAS